MVQRWYVSDHHLGHWNIIRYCKRPFASVKEMNEALLQYHNETVKNNDHVSFLGDVTIRRGGRLNREWFCKEMKKYNGHKRLYLGNHDHFPVRTYLDAGFEKIYATWRSEEGIICSHIPLHPQSLSKATANVHGHIHNNESGAYKPIQVNDRVVPYINVCVEVRDYKPVHLDMLLLEIQQCQHV